MSREFAKSEIIRQKCSICGIKNKKFTEILYSGNPCGYKLTCCNCGHEDKFIKNINNTLDHVYDTGREVCIHITTCKNRNCPYYGKYSLKKAAELIDIILKDIDGLNNDGNIDTDDSNNNDCICRDPSCPCGCNSNNSKCPNNFSDIIKLDINGYEIDKPKFH